MFERRLLRNLDRPLIAAVLALSLYGLAMVYSASFTNRDLTGGDPSYFVKRQGAWLAAGVALAAVFAYLDYQHLMRLHRLIWAGIVVALLAVMVAGHAAGGAARWVGLGSFRFQPSEFAKVGLIITLAALLVRRGHAARLATPAAAALHMMAPIALIALQPDLGTALVLLVVLFVMLFAAGARTLHLGVAAAVVGLLLVGAWKWDVLRPYQKARLAVFLDPGADPLGSGYHVIQSKIAVGSGQWWGKGYLAGSQSQLHFIPAQHTDFIFTVVGEELGVVGAMGLLGLYLVVLWRALSIMERADDPFGALVAGGIAGAFAVQVLVNIGMTVNIMPVTGLPLPFFSYGGSSLAASMIAVGLLLSVGMRRQRIRF